MADVGFIEIHAPGLAVQVDSTNHPLTVFYTMQSTASPPHARATQLLRIRQSLMEKGEVDIWNYKGFEKMHTSVCNTRRRYQAKYCQGVYGSGDNNSSHNSWLYIWQFLANKICNFDVEIYSMSLYGPSSWIWQGHESHDRYRISNHLQHNRFNIFTCQIDVDPNAFLE